MSEERRTAVPVIGEFFVVQDEETLSILSAYLKVEVNQEKVKTNDELSEMTGTGTMRLSQWDAISMLRAMGAEIAEML